MLVDSVQMLGWNERGLEDQSGFLSGHLLFEAALVEGLAYGAGATTVALEGYQASATLSKSNVSRGLSQMRSRDGVRRRQ